MSTLLKVAGEREWPSQHGPMVSIRLEFDGGLQAELTTKPEFKVARLETLEGLVGKDSPEWAFEDKGEFSPGHPKPKKVTGYPGKPTPSGNQGDGKKSYTPRFTDTPEGFWINDERVDRRKALEVAVALYTPPRGDGDDLDAINMARRFYAFLRETASGTAIAGGVLRPAPLVVPEESSPADQTKPETRAAPGVAQVPVEHRLKGSEVTGNPPAAYAPAGVPSPVAAAGSGAGDTSPAAPPAGREAVGAGSDGEAGPVPPHAHDLDRTKKNKGGFSPCRSCGAWAK